MSASFSEARVVKRVYITTIGDPHLSLSIVAEFNILSLIYSDILASPRLFIHYTPNLRPHKIPLLTALKTTTSSTSTLVSCLAFFSLASFAHSLTTTASPSASSITWSNFTSNDPLSLPCSSIQVPPNHNNPNGATITLAIARLKSPTATRKGNLLYNPGGTGGSTTQALFAVVELCAPLFSLNILDCYDIIGFDPRGVGLSTGIRCDPDLWNTRESIWPEDEGEFDDMVATNREFYASCAELTGPLFDRVDTTSVAKDFKLMRLALGDEGLNLFAQSYGF
ncbi:hypothetical protein Vi05172_g11368 [Venturia inaequalis]|nr:hypothetical protein Vi05172_g11368 [Venturia inaequalis]